MRWSRRFAARKFPRVNHGYVDPEEHWGVLTTVVDGQTHKRKVPSHGDWREFYANVRDAILGQADLLVTPKQIIAVMVARHLAQESSRLRCVVPWRNVAL